MTSVPKAVQQINVSSKFITSRTCAGSSKDDHLYVKTADPTLKSKLSSDEETIRQIEINTSQSITSLNGETNESFNEEVPGEQTGNFCRYYYFFQNTVLN